MELRFASEEEKKHKGARLFFERKKQIAVQPAAWRIYLAQRGFLPLFTSKRALGFSKETFQYELY